MEWTLDQLLQLKRHEKPAPEFWDEFEKRLNEKQLQMFVSEPWSQVIARGWLPRRLGIVAPLSMAALFVLGFSFFLNTMEVGKQYATDAAAPVEFPVSVLLYPTAIPPLSVSDVTASVPGGVPDVPRLHASFVVDALSKQEQGMQKPYTTVDSPAVMMVSDGNSSRYVVHSFTSEASFSSRGNEPGTSEF
ncbi:MAG: hypothetical protein WD490_03980 [Opitutales bacterium]